MSLFYTFRKVRTSHAEAASLCARNIHLDCNNEKIFRPLKKKVHPPDYSLKFPNMRKIFTTAHPPSPSFSVSPFNEIQVLPLHYSYRPKKEKRSRRKGPPNALRLRRRILKSRREESKEVRTLNTQRYTSARPYQYISDGRPSKKAEGEKKIAPRRKSEG